MDNLLRIIIQNRAGMWLKENPLLLDDQEKQKFLKGLKEYLDESSKIIDDEVFDFLVECELINNESRQASYLKYLRKKYPNLSQYKVLDVGAGRTCLLSKLLTRRCKEVVAMDPKIRLSDEQLTKAQILGIKNPFVCDDFMSNNNGTDIQKYDLVLGLEPCDATEHIIRQALKYDKQFNISLCAAPHKSLEGKNFTTYQQWYKHLAQISREVAIEEQNFGVVATNN